MSGCPAICPVAGGQAKQLLSILEVSAYVLTAFEGQKVTGTDWLDLVKIVVGAGIGTAVVQWLASIAADERSKKSKADFLALQLAINLEAFARQCIELDRENEFAEHHPDQQFPDWSATLPSISQTPDDIDGWRSLDQNMVGRYYNLWADRDAEQKSLSEALYHVEDDLEEYVALSVEKLGSRALKLATEIRTRHGLLLSQPDIGEMEERFVRRAKWAQEQLDAERQRNTRLAASLLPKDEPQGQ
ncbi:hypothetical protein F9K87_16160 [Brucella anthropi]|uniref:hypothetical protein n=1 Tax=Brucella anthropi TaxID=529 RepID=UPI00124E6C0F|nr:hypothetical protein [Brucella anthropi]KAB2795935.1 hypothetical protein F9K87_16160 [Brucella anthropi]